jgi:P-type conjugative transfer protein TrbJ
MRSLLAVFLVLTAVWSTPAAAQLGACPCVVTDPALESTTVTSFGKEIVNEAKSLATQANQYLTEINSYATQVQQYENEIQNTINVPAQTLANLQGVINHAASVVQNIVGIYQRAEGLAISVENIDKQFQLRFPGYISTAPIFSSGTVGASVSAPAAATQARLNGTLDSIRGSMAALNANAMDIQSDVLAANTLQSASAAATGTVQALQVAHNIALQQVNQLGKLQEDVLGIGQAETNYYAGQVQDHSDRIAGMQRFAHFVPDAW